MKRSALKKPPKDREASWWSRAWPVARDILRLATPYIIFLLATHQPVVDQVPRFMLV
jgi:hypothetical protein